MNSQSPSTEPDDSDPADAWNATRYNSHFSFIWEYGSSLVDLLDPQYGERILDLGCGTGHLTNQIAERGASVIGIDVSKDMVAKARNAYPGLDFRVGNATSFSIEKPVHGIFSNATLHWVHPPEQAVRAMYEALLPGGRIVVEFGGHGNVLSLRQAIGQALEEAGYPDPHGRNPWYFPGIATYTTLLENSEFEPASAVLFDRPTRLEPGDEGLQQWLAMFTDTFFKDVTASDRESINQRIEEILRPANYREGIWYADYRRLRVTATRPS